MESLSLMFFLEIGLIVLLIAGLVYMNSINNKLKLLRNGGDGFRSVVVELNHATDNAQNAIQGLKLTVRDAEHGLDGNLKQARSAIEELKYLLTQAAVYSEGIQVTGGRNIPPVSDNLRNVTQPTVLQNKPKNFADQTLEKVAKRKQSLPNPIIHNHENRTSYEDRVSYDNRDDYENSYAEPLNDTGNAFNYERSDDLRDDPNLGQNIPMEHREMALQMREETLKSMATKSVEQNKRRPTVRPNHLERPGGSAMQNRQTTSQRLDVGRQALSSGRDAVEKRSQFLASQPNQAVEHGQMNLNDMAERHNKFERPKVMQNQQSMGLTSGQMQAGSEPKSLDDKRQSLFQKLGKTR